MRNSVGFLVKCSGVQRFSPQSKSFFQKYGKKSSKGGQSLEFNKTIIPLAFVGYEKIIATRRMHLVG